MVPRPATKDIDSAPTWFVRSREDGYTFDSDNFRLHMEYERVNWNAYVTDIYTIDGKRIPALRHGVNIVRMSDGTVKKVVK